MVCGRLRCVRSCVSLCLACVLVVVLALPMAASASAQGVASTTNYSFDFQSWDGSNTGFWGGPSSSYPSLNLSHTNTSRSNSQTFTITRWDNVATPQILVPGLFSSSSSSSVGYKSLYVDSSSDRTLAPAGSRITVTLPNTAHTYETYLTTDRIVDFGFSPNTKKATALKWITANRSCNIFVTLAYHDSSGYHGFYTSPATYSSNSNTIVIDSSNVTQNVDRLYIIFQYSLTSISTITPLSGSSGIVPYSSSSLNRYDLGSLGSDSALLSSVPSRSTIGLNPDLANTTVEVQMLTSDQSLNAVASNTGGILSKITSIFEYLPQIPSLIISALQTAVTTIMQIPSMIIDGIKSLFIPSDSDLQDVFSEFNAFFSLKLGALWQIGTFVHDFFSTILSAGTTSTISFPSVDLSSAGIPFTFGGWEVDVWPAWLPPGVATSIRFINTMVFVGAWVYGLQRWLDKFLGGGSD